MNFTQVAVKNVYFTDQDIVSPQPTLLMPPVLKLVNICYPEVLYMFDRYQLHAPSFTILLNQNLRKISYKCTKI